MDVSKTDAQKATAIILDELRRGESLNISYEAERELAKRSTYYLAKEVLEYKDLNESFHQALCHFYDRHLFDLQLHLHPRKHFKTTLITVAGKMRLALINPNVTICICANTVSNAETYLREIRNHFLKNDKFRDLFPEHAPVRKREEGTSDRFITPARTKPWIRMGTFEAAGIDRAIVSRHYDIINFDDVVDDKNTTTAELRRKVYEAYTTSLSVTSITKKNLPWHHIVGTRWHLGDAYATLLEEQRQTHKFKVFITQAYWKEKTENGYTTRFLFPERFPMEALEYLRKTQSDARFSCLYLNNPVPDDSAVMDPDFFKYYDDKDLPKKLNKVITVDPASSEETRLGDPTVITVAGMDEKSNIYILEVLRGWWNPDEIVQNILDAQVRHNVRVIGIEAVSFQKWLCFYIDKVRHEKHLRFKVEAIKRNTQVRKSKRHERIIPYHRNGKIFYHQNEPEFAIIKKEHREYPSGRYDDFLDTLTDAIELLKPVAKYRKESIDYRLPPRQLNSRSRFQTGYSVRAGGYSG